MIRTDQSQNLETKPCTHADDVTGSGGGVLEGTAVLGLGSRAEAENRAVVLPHCRKKKKKKKVGARRRHAKKVHHEMMMVIVAGRCKRALYE